jgi:hypothetical protein
MSSSVRVPSYRLHKGSGQAVVVLGGRSIYLGKFGTTASKVEYRRVTAEWLANDRRPPIATVRPQSHELAGEPGGRSAHCALTVGHLLIAYWKHVQTYYLKNGEPSEQPAPQGQNAR